MEVPHIKGRLPWFGSAMAFGADPEFTKAGKPVKFHLLPFGGGKSICPGRHFAMNELKWLISLLVEAFDFELLSGGVP